MLNEDKIYSDAAEIMSGTKDHDHPDYKFALESFYSYESPERDYFVSKVVSNTTALKSKLPPDLKSEFKTIDATKGDVTRFSGYLTIKNFLKESATKEWTIHMKDILIAGGITGVTGVFLGPIIGQASSMTYSVLAGKRKEEQGVLDLGQINSKMKQLLKHLEKHKKLYMDAYAQKNEPVILEYECSIYLLSVIPAYTHSSFLAKRKEIGLHSLKIQTIEYVDSVITATHVKELKRSVYNEDGVLMPLNEEVATMMIAAGIVIAAFTFMRYFVYFIFKTKVKISDGLDYQASLLESNIIKVENIKTIDPKKKQAIVEKQKRIYDKLIHMSNKFAVKFVDTAPEALPPQANDSLATVKGISKSDTQKDIPVAPIKSVQKVDKPSSSNTDFLI
jgi:hypothetical protein